MSPLPPFSYVFHSVIILCLFQLMEFLTDNDEATAEDVLVFIREAVQRYSQLKPTIVGKLLEIFPHIKLIK